MCIVLDISLIEKECVVLRCTNREIYKKERVTFPANENGNVNYMTINKQDANTGNYLIPGGGILGLSFSICYFTFRHTIYTLCTLHKPSTVFTYISTPHHSSKLVKLCKKYISCFPNVYTFCSPRHDLNANRLKYYQVCN